MLSEPLEEVFMEFIHVTGENKGKVILYAISTCIWCKKTKQLLNDIGVEYSFVDVDLLDQNEKDAVKREVFKWKKTIGYPLIVIDDKECIPTFDEDIIKSRFG